MSESRPPDFHVPRVLPPIPGGQPASGDQFSDHIIPIKNPAALIGYYCGIFALVPVIGVPLIFAAFGCGIGGLLKIKSSGSKIGLAHAIVALVLGCGAVLEQLFVCFLLFMT